MDEDNIIIKANIPVPSHLNSKIVLEIPRNISTVKDIVKVVESIVNEKLDPHELLILCANKDDEIIKVLYPDDEISPNCISVYIYFQPSGG